MTVGLDAVRCRIDILAETIAETSATDLGGPNLARALARNVSRADTFTAEPTTPKRLKKAATQLKKFAAKVDRGVSKGKIDAALGAELVEIAVQARDQLLGLLASS
jgi:hypothetical protein